MDEKLQRQLIRQLKVLNFWITTMGVLLLVALAIIGFLLFQVIAFVRQVGDDVQRFQQGASEQIDLQQRACQDDGAFGAFLRQQGDLCQ